jgi:hypothetical protein
METFGATPFPRISEIVDLAEVGNPDIPAFQFLKTKLLRQRNAVEDGFFQANMLIEKTLERLNLLTL